MNKKVKRALILGTALVGSLALMFHGSKNEITEYNDGINAENKRKMDIITRTDESGKVRVSQEEYFDYIMQNYVPNAIEKDSVTVKIEDLFLKSKPEAEVNMANVLSAFDPTEKFSLNN
jgi:hypothetical protein